MRAARRLAALVLAASLVGCVADTEADEPVSRGALSGNAERVIWFHGMQDVGDLPSYLGVRDAELSVPVAKQRGNSGFYEWGVGEDPWPRELPSEARIMVSGFSLGRRAFFNFLKMHPSDRVQRAVLFDPCYAWETYGGKDGFEVVADWLAGDALREFTYVEGSCSKDHGASAKFQSMVDGHPDLAPRIRLHKVHGVAHLDVMPEARACLFGTCGDRVSAGPPQP
jgi:hypothetical protein